VIHVDVDIVDVVEKYIDAFNAVFGCPLDMQRYTIL
jgi:hypothetical protein